MKEKRITPNLKGNPNLKYDIKIPYPCLQKLNLANSNPIIIKILIKVKRATFGSLLLTYSNSLILKRNVRDVPAKYQSPNIKGKIKAQLRSFYYL